MKSLADAAVRSALRRRVETLSLTSERRWGKMNVQQMLTHVAGAMELVVGGGQMPAATHPPRPLIKFFALKLPLPWPRGVYNPRDPASVPVPASDFEAARARVLAGIDAMGAWEKTAVTTHHTIFGDLTTREWQRWAFKHADHHLKQFSA